MGKFFLLMLVFFGLAFSQDNLTFKAVHRFYFSLENDNLVYTNNAPEISSFSFYFNRDTSKVSYFLHTTPDMASKYYTITEPTFTDSTMECIVKSDAGNLYLYKFKPKSGYIYAKDIKVINKEFISSYMVLFVLPEIKHVNFKNRVYMSE